MFKKNIELGTIENLEDYEAAVALKERIEDMIDEYGTNNIAQVDMFWEHQDLVKKYNELQKQMDHRKTNVERLPQLGLDLGMKCDDFRDRWAEIRQAVYTFEELRKEEKVEMLVNSDVALTTAEMTQGQANKQAEEKLEEIKEEEPDITADMMDRVREIYAESENDQKAWRQVMRAFGSLKGKILKDNYLAEREHAEEMAKNEQKEERIEPDNVEVATAEKKVEKKKAKAEPKTMTDAEMVKMAIDEVLPKIGPKDSVRPKIIQALESKRIMFELTQVTKVLEMLMDEAVIYQPVLNGDFFKV